MRIGKKTISLVLTICLLLLMATNVFAIGLIPVAKPTAISGTESMIEKVLGIIEAGAYAVALGMLFYVGIKYTMVAANEKAEVKASSVKYIVGAILIFGSTTFVKIIIGMMENDVGGELPGVG